MNTDEFDVSGQKDRDDDKKVKTKDFKQIDTLYYDDDVKKDYVPEGFKTVEDFLSDMREEYQLDLDGDRINREAAIDDKKFSAGEQWDPVVLQHRKGLPCLVINSVPQFTAQLVGDWRENKIGIKVVPCGDGDEDIAEIRGDLIRAIQTQCRAERVYNNAFESMVQCGDGAFRVAVRYSRNDVFDQDITIEPIDDALACVWDRFSVDPTGRDARHVFVDDNLSRKEFDRKWPKDNPSNLSIDYRNSLYSGGWLSDEGVKVTEYWRMIERQRLLAMFSDGTIHILDKQNLEDLIAKHGQPARTRMAPVTYAQLHLVTGFSILSGPHEYMLNRVPIIRMTGRMVNVNGRRVRFGLVRFMKDAVRLKNFWRSVAAEQLGYAPKAQWIATASAVEGREDTLRKAHLTRDPLLVVNDEAIIGQNLQRLEPPAPQAALLQEANVNSQDMKDITGIQDASLGIRSNETSGRAINARQREGDIASLTYYDNGNASVLEAGDVINQLISQVYDGTRIIRVVGEDEAVKFTKINDPNDPHSPDLAIGNYDIAMTSGTTYTTRRVEAAQAMMDAVQVWPQLLQVAGDLVAKAQDWPGADKLADRLKKTIPPQFLDDNDKDKQQPQMTPQELQQLQMEVHALLQENQQLKADKTIDFMKVQVESYNAETKRIAALSDNAVDANSLELQGIKHILDHSIDIQTLEQASSAAAQSASASNNSQ